MQGRGMPSGLQVGFLGHLGSMLGDMWQGNTEVSPSILPALTSRELQAIPRGG